MLKALRIASVAAVIGAVVVLAAVAVLGFRGDPEIEAFLAQEGVVEQFRKRSQTAPAVKPDAVSPLEQAAKAFALRIDPPPPPPPPKPVEPPKPPEVKPPVVQPPRPPENRQPTLTAKFTLIATARYPDHPEKSMALLQNVQNEYKWYRQGDQVGHLVIHEIKDGSIVLYQGDKFNSELFMPAPPPTISLLKSERALASAAPRGPSSVSAPSIAPESNEEMQADTLGQSADGQPGTAASRPPRPQPVSSSPRITTTVQTPEELSAIVLSPKEQIRSIEENIAAIENIMRQTATQEGQSEEERQAEQQVWQEFLKVLAKEKETLLQAASDGEPSAEKKTESSPAKEADASQKTQ